MGWYICLKGKGMHWEKKKRKNYLWDIHNGLIQCYCKTPTCPFWKMAQYIPLENLSGAQKGFRRSLLGHAKITSSWWRMITEGLLILLYLASAQSGLPGQRENSEAIRSRPLCHLGITLSALWYIKWDNEAHLMKIEWNTFLNWHNKVYTYFSLHLNIKNPKL